jgi:serine/threonine protein kinase
MLSTIDDGQDWVFSAREIELTTTVLGKGAFGVVRVGKWRNIEVACKSLHALDSSDVEQLDQEGWMHEISMLSKLRHPNLVLFLGICQGQTGSNVSTTILTELLPCSLYDILEVRKSVLSFADILDIALDIANGLDYLHKHAPQIVHRDISSKNILLGGNKAKIADLGQAKIFGHNTLSRQTGMPGAMAYSAPEVLTGKYSAKIDVFSYGILVAQMCSGEYPRIDRREAQIEQAGAAHPVLHSLIVSMVSYQPHERPSAEAVCRALDELRSNDRYYPLARRSHPEKDLGILGRHWMLGEIERQCREVSTELVRTRSLLAAEEVRWRHEAGKVDGINERLAASQEELRTTATSLERLRIEHSDLQAKLAQAGEANGQLTSQLYILGEEIRRTQEKCEQQEAQLLQAYQDMDMARDAVQHYRDEQQVTAQQLESSKRSEAELAKQGIQVKLQLEMQVEYVRDLENRLEQTLTRWKLEKDALREEKARYAKLNQQCAQMVAHSTAQAQTLEKYENRLKQYDDLPMPVSSYVSYFSFFLFRGLFHVFGFNVCIFRKKLKNVLKIFKMMSTMHGTR